MSRLTLESWYDVTESGSQVKASTPGDVRASGRLYSSMRLQMGSIGYTTGPLWYPQLVHGARV